MIPFLVQTIQRDSSIGFPLLGNFTINPPSYITIFGFNIYFYGVIIACGFLLGTMYAAKMAPKFGIKGDDIYDLVLFMLPIGIIGARLYYVLFSLDYYLQYPSEIFAIHNGGLAIYGGIIFGVLTIFFVARHKKIPFPAMVDVVIFGLLIGQILGRWGNFMNREAFGAETTIFCRMSLTATDGSTIYVHPTFLYESLWNLICLIYLIIRTNKGKRQYDGQNTLIYFLWYGIGRCWIEGLRTDSLYLGSTGIRVSQLLSALLALAALAALILLSRRPHPPEKLFVNRVAMSGIISISKAPEAEDSAPAEEAPVTKEADPEEQAGQADECGPAAPESKDKTET